MCHLKATFTSNHKRRYLIVKGCKVPNSTSFPNHIDVDSNPYDALSTKLPRHQIIKTQEKTIVPTARVFLLKYMVFLFLYLFFSHSNIDFKQTRTRTAGVQGEHSDHWAMILDGHSLAESPAIVGSRVVNLILNWMKKLFSLAMS